MRKKIGKKYLMSINSSSSRVIKANSFDKYTFFTLWFYLINICLFRASICRDDQGKANKKKVENIGISRIDTEKNTDRLDIEKNISGINKKKS